jgi:DNA ligase (NAD+)
MSIEIESLSAEEVLAQFEGFDADQLTALVARANREYWEDNDASLPDPLYDRLVERLRELRPDAAILQSLGEKLPEGDAIAADAIAAIPPIKRLGAAVKHRRSMLSLDKCYTDEELMAWAKKFEGEVMVMPKMDGIACSLRYDRKGKLVVAATRGSGSEGEDITVNVVDVPDVPTQVDFGKRELNDDELEIRGELYMRLSVFRERFAAEYSNPRNLTAGAVKHKERDNQKRHHLSFFAYDLDGFDLVDEREKLDELRRMGFPSEYCRIVSREEMSAAYREFEEKRASELDYEIDGVVYRTSRASEQRRMGETGHHPRWSIAYKFQGDSGTTALRDVEWSVSRTGTITPVALLEPISLSGAMIGRASLHNLGLFEELGLTQGCTVEVTRRGGVIPKVERVVEAGSGPAYAIPESCPACGGEVEVRKKRDGEFLYCKAPENCIQARLGELEHFAKVVKIEGFGPKIVAQAVEKGLLNTPADYYRLTLEQLQSFDRLGRKSAQNLIDEVEAHRELPLATFLQALGIDHLGKQFATLLVDNFPDLAAIRSVSVEQLIEIKGIKDAIAETLVAGFESRAKLIDDLLTELRLVVPTAEERAAKAAPKQGALVGQSFLFTGALEAFNRKEAQKMVDANGGENAKSVTKALTFLVVGAGKGQKSSKQKKAEKLSEAGEPIQIITEDEFRAMIGGD